MRQPPQPRATPKKGSLKPLAFIEILGYRTSRPLARTNALEDFDRLFERQGFSGSYLLSQCRGPAQKIHNNLVFRYKLLRLLLIVSARFHLSPHLS